MALKPLSFWSVALKVMESWFCQGGHYLREVAVLIIVFIPLDFWKHSEITAGRIAEVFGWSALAFLSGMVCEWTSYAVKWGKHIVEELERAK